MQFVIDKSKWRCGELSPESSCRLGEGYTELLNDKGYMCCLGQISLQLGCTKKEIHNLTYPSDVTKLSVKDNILVKDGECTNLSDEAIDINDSTMLTIAEKEKRLTKLFAKEGVKLTFIGSKGQTKGKVKNMVRKSVLVNVRGVERRAYLGRELGKNKWKAQVYINDAGRRTSVTGTLSVNTNGVKRFVPSASAVNADLL